MKRSFLLTLAVLFLSILSPWNNVCRGQNQEGIPVKVMSFNIRLETSADKENAWEFRKEALVGEITDTGPDLLGVQEAKWGQMQFLIAGLPAYDWIGVGRDDGQQGGEFSAVFYKKDRFEALDSGTFWLSETPDVPGSRGWDAACRRVVSWGKFRVKDQTDHLFIFANTHFDHVGKIARLRSASLLRSRLAALAGSLPLLVSGDFNCLCTSDTYQALTTASDGNAALVDTNFAARVRDLPVARTFHDYGKNPGDNPMIIDYIFVSGNVQVDRFSILPEKRDGRFTSDHCPITATCRLP